jgi:hypothetical protein
MLSAPFSAPRAISGIEIIASGSIGVPGTTTERGSRWARFVHTGRRFSTAQPVMPSPKRGRLRMISSSYSLDRAFSGTSSRRSSSAS